MERRANPRHPLNLGALFAVNQQEYQRCIIRDFCVGGMFLAYPQSDYRLVVKRNDRVHINVTLHDDQKTPAHYFVEAKVARVFQYGIGVALINPNRLLLQKLHQISSAIAPPPSVVSEPPATVLPGQTATFIKIIHQHLSSMLLHFFHEVSAALFKTANMANSNTEQGQHLDAIRELKKLQQPIETLFINQIVQQLKQPELPTPQPPSRLDELSLVDQEEFEDWLNIANLISKAEMHYEQWLLDLQPRLSQAFQVKYHKDNLPVGPAVLYQAFHQASQAMETQPATKKIIYQVFEKAFIHRLQGLYEELQTLLDQQGIARAKHKLQVYKASDLMQPLAAPRSTVGTSAPAVAPIAPLTRLPSSGSSSSSTYETLCQLAQWAPVTAFKIPVELSSRLAPATALVPQQQQLISSVEQLLTAIGTDQRLTKPVQLWFKDLRLPALQFALQQPQRLAKADNPLQPLLDQLAELGQLVTADDKIVNHSIKQQIDALITQLADSADPAQSFTEATAQLQSLLERQRKIYQRNLERVTQTCDGKYKLIQSRKLVEQALIQQFAHQPVPEVILDLLESGWRDFMVLIHVRHGSHHPEWQQQLKRLTQLRQAFEHVPLIQPALEHLLAEVQLGLQQSSIDKLKQHELLDQLEGCLSGQIAVTYRSYQTPASSTSAESQPVDTYWLRQAAKLTIGDWVDITLDAVTRPARLAWISQDKTQFVLVNRQGLTVAELSLAQMAQQMAQQSQPAPLDANMGTLDRAMYTLFQQMYEQLAYQSTHDPLTGLFNRKAFTEKINQYLRQAKRTHALLAYLDIDQFKVINNTCNHHAGDLALQQIARHLQQQLPPQTLLARLGGDEFGILMTELDFNESYRRIEQQRGEIEALRVTYENKVFSHTVSIGIVEVIPESAEVSQLFRAADEACYAAKNAGRNRLQLYQSDDAELSRRRHIMQWVAEIHETIEQGRLRLRCQRITPLSDPQLTPHYEILLSVMDKNGIWQPPVDFIQAAESYQRMTLVDQWVVETTLNWLNQYPSVLDTMGGLAINLSGQSLTDAHFLQFILRQLQLTRIPLHKLCFEVTETVAMSNFNQGLSFMQDIRALGCEFALDDFGSGLSSYAYLKNMPVDYLKIDGIFIRDILTNPNDQAMVKSINEISHVMGKKTIAEYVANEAILDYLKTIGVDYAQGYGVEKPRVLFEMVN